MEKDLDMFVPATEECVAETGKPPISTKWVDVNKGTVQNQCIRSKLVSRDFRVKSESNRSDLFAAMPPLEAKGMLLRMAVRRCREKQREKYKIRLIDVKKTHLNGEVPEDKKVFVLLPSEAGGGVARLKRWQHGIRPVAKAWEQHHGRGRVPEEHLARQRYLATEVERELGGARDGDDFTAWGPEQHMRQLERQMRTWFAMKTQEVLGPEPHNDKDITVLNRRLVWCHGFITYEGDPRIVGNILEATGLEEGSKTLDSPIVASKF